MNKPAAGTLLLVEDERDTRMMLVMGLRLQGYQVAHAPNGKVALEMLQSDPLPSLVLLDRSMPEMDGVELLERMGEDPRLDAVPVVLLSGDEDLVQNPRVERAVKILFKPVSLPRLLQVVRQYLGAA